MPRQQQSFTITSPNKETTLAICYSSFRQLNWDILFAGEDKLLAGTPPVWKSKGQQVMVEATGEQLIISSEMVNDEVFDLGGKNKKNIAAFWNAFEKCRQTITETEIIDTTAAIEVLKAKTMDIAEQEAKEAAEIDAAMNLSKSNLYVTYAIIAVNVLVFVLMAINGAGIFDPNGLVHISWGSNYGILTKSGEWWRLLTCVFIHFGIIHLAMNMYCLYSIGIYLEPMLGKIRFITAYLCTGVLASLTSLWWHTEAKNSAGASGAVFGMYGLFLALLTTSLIPKKVRTALLQNIGIFVVYNLVYGLQSGVDNAAHVGGLISGFGIGYLFAMAIKKEKQQLKLNWVIPVVLVGTIGGSFLYLQQHKITGTERIAVQNELSASSFKDYEKYNSRLEEIGLLEEQAVAPLNDTSLSNEQLKNKFDSVSKPAWQQIETKLHQMQQYDVAGSKKKKAILFLEYVAMRKNEIELFEKFITDNQEESFSTSLNLLRQKMGILVEEILKL